MGTLLKTKKKMPSLNLLTLLAACVPGRESSSLTIKRAAQLEWMHKKGLRYLGDARKSAPSGPPPAADARVRLVGARSRQDATPAARAAANET